MWDPEDILQTVGEQLQDKKQSLDFVLTRRNIPPHPISGQFNFKVFASVHSSSVCRSQARLTCPCCNSRVKDAVLTKCFHVFCFECVKTRYDTRQRKCPKCNAAFGANDFHRIYIGWRWKPTYTRESVESKPWTVGEMLQGETPHSQHVPSRLNRTLALMLWTECFSSFFSPSDYFYHPVSTISLLSNRCKFASGNISTIPSKRNTVTIKQVLSVW